MPRAPRRSGSIPAARQYFLTSRHGVLRSRCRRISRAAAGEFGRTPRLTRAGGLVGRDHWPDAQSALVSGGGLRMGQVIGATNRRGEYPVERRLTPQDLLATIDRHLGIDHRAEFRDLSGRPMRILADGEPIRELI